MISLTDISQSVGSIFKILSAERLKATFGYLVGLGNSLLPANTSRSPQVTFSVTLNSGLLLLTSYSFNPPLTTLPVVTIILTQICRGHKKSF